MYRQVMTKQELNVQVVELSTDLMLKNQVTVGDKILSLIIKTS